MERAEDVARICSLALTLAFTLQAGQRFLEGRCPVGDICMSVGTSVPPHRVNNWAEWEGHSHRRTGESAASPRRLCRAGVGCRGATPGSGPRSPVSSLITEWSSGGVQAEAKRCSSSPTVPSHHVSTSEEPGGASYS